MIALDFTGRIVLVTGGSSGIGLAAAQAFRRAGAIVHVTGTRGAPADYPAGDLDGLTYHQLDAANADAVDAFEPGLDRLDVLVNAIGVTEYARAEFKTDVFQRVLQVNLTSLFQLCEKCRPLLAASRGAIVNVGSLASLRGVYGNPAYSASKGGLLTLTRTLAQAYATDGVRVNLAAPGMIRTKLTEVTWTHDKRRRSMEAAIPLGRLGEPEDLAGPILFLASDLARYVTGEILAVDGGMNA